MKRTTCLAVAIVLLAPLCPLAPLNARVDKEPDTDPDTGLVIADGWHLVAANCAACHSLRLVTSQRGDADFWRDTILWMQRTQNLWQIPEEQELKLVRYLGTHYNETDWGRREPLAASLLPSPPDTPTSH